MRWCKVEVGCTRINCWFAILPVTIGHETRWLETIRVKQERVWVYSPAGVGTLQWTNRAFLDDIPIKGAT